MADRDIEAELHGKVQARRAWDRPVQVPPERPCLRCVSHDQAVPTEAELRRLTAGVSVDAEVYYPTPGTPEQNAAAAGLASALHHYIHAFGIRSAGARLAVTVACLRVGAKHHAIMERVLDARRQINMRRLKLQAEGKWDESSALLAEPTPNYPGKDRDDVWLAEVGHDL